MFCCTWGVCHCVYVISMLSLLLCGLPPCCVPPAPLCFLPVYFPLPTPAPFHPLFPALLPPPLPFSYPLPLPCILTILLLSLRLFPGPLITFNMVIPTLTAFITFCEIVVHKYSLLFVNYFLNPTFHSTVTLKLNYPKTYYLICSPNSFNYTLLINSSLYYLL